MDADLVTSRLYVKYDKKFLGKCKNLKAIFNQSVGYDNIDIEYATKKGIRVFNCPKYNANAVAELVFSTITSLARNISSAREHVVSGGTEYRIFEGFELKGKTLGIIGAGNVGTRVGEIAKGYKMKVNYHTLNPSAKRAKELGIQKFMTLKEILESSDILVIAVPLNDSTKGMIGRDELSLMKRSAILVNCARPLIIDEHALAEFLVNGRLGGASLDLLLEDPFNVRKHPLLIQEMVNLPNVIVTPHIGAETKEANEKLGEIFLINVKGFLKGKKENCVNC
jgi:phosphoglycerate dehydrogenase-like enzyme